MTNIDSILRDLPEFFSALERSRDNKSESSKNIQCNDNECHCGHHDQERHNPICDMSKAYWVDKAVKDDTVTTIFHVIAPFARESSIKATVSKIDNVQWLILRYENDDTIFDNCTSCNFRIDKTVEYKYNLNKYKIDKNKLKLSYDRGVINLYTVASKSSRNDDYTIGL